MEDWGNFYTLLGTVAGTLIGLLFVVISFSSDRKIDGDEQRTRMFATPPLVYFTTLLLLSLALAAPIEDQFRALALGILGCVGLGYVTNLAMTSRRRNDVQDYEVVWDVVFPLTASILISVADCMGPRRQFRRWHRCRRRGRAADRRNSQELAGRALDCRAAQTQVKGLHSDGPI